MKTFIIIIIIIIIIIRLLLCVRQTSFLSSISSEFVLNSFPRAIFMLFQSII